MSLVEHADDARTPAATAWLISGSVTVMLLSLVVVVRTLADAGRLAELYRPMPAVLASAAVVALVLGWARPAPWLLALALDVVLSVTWWIAFARWVRSGMRSRAAVE